MLICQLTNSTLEQMMGYLIRTKNGKLIVIDGGSHGQSKLLSDAIFAWGGQVDYWFLTHEHSDHYASLMELVKNGAPIAIDGIYRSLCRGEAERTLPEAEKKEHLTWLQFERECGIPLYDFKLGQEFWIDGIKIEVLGIDNPEITVNQLNNQSVVLRISEGDFSMLFLGDLGVEGGEKLLKTAGDKLKSTAVQMAHHGQKGVSLDLYDQIGAKYAFWPTPKWLWENNSKYLGGGEPGKGSFETPQNIEKMNRLGAVNITSFDYNTVFDTSSMKITTDAD